MEPRWYSDWGLDGTCQYLGGTPTYDLWIDERRDIRVVKDYGADNWDWFHWNREVDRFLWGSKDMDGVDHTELLEEVLLYMSLFAPWAIEQTKNGSADYHSWVKFNPCLNSDGEE
jgi:hypothetical protein